MTWNDITGQKDRQEDRLDRFIDENVRPQIVRSVKRNQKVDLAWARKAARAKPGLKDDGIQMMFVIKGKVIDREGCDDEIDLTGLVGEHGTRVLREQFAAIRDKVQKEFGLSDAEAVFMAVSRVWRLHFPILEARCPGVRTKVYINGSIHTVSRARVKDYKDIFVRPEVPDIGNAEPVPIPEWTKRTTADMKFLSREYMKRGYYRAELLLVQDGEKIGFELEIRLIGRLVKKCDAELVPPEGIVRILRQSDDREVMDSFREEDLGKLVMDRDWGKAPAVSAHPDKDQKYMTSDDRAERKRFENRIRRFLAPEGEQVDWNSKEMRFYGPWKDMDEDLACRPEVPESVMLIISHTERTLRNIYAKRLENHPESERWRRERATGWAGGWLTYITGADIGLF